MLKNVIQIRKLEAEDIDLMRMLNEVFVEAFQEHETYLAKKPSDEYLRALLKKDNLLVYVALDGQRVVAGLAAYVLEKFEQERKEVYIYDLAVEENYRRIKLATRLIKALKEESRRLGAWVVYVQADPVDTPAVKLYESLGIREEVLHFDLTLEDRQEDM